jgi:hypothetical protein
MSKLREAVVEFERCLPKNPGSWTHINTRETWAYGQLHRVYYDVAKLGEEDPALVSVIKPFVVQNGSGKPRVSMTPNEHDPEVVELRRYLNECK